MRDLHEYEVRLLQKGYRSAEVEIPVLQEMWRNPGGGNIEIARRFVPFLEVLARSGLEYFGISREEIRDQPVEEEMVENRWPRDYKISKEFHRESNGQLLARIHSSYAIENPRDGDGLGISVRMFHLPSPAEGVSFSVSYWLRQEGVNAHLSGFHLSAESLSRWVELCGDAFACEVRVVGGIAPEDYPAVMKPGSE